MPRIRREASHNQTIRSPPSYNRNPRPHIKVQHLGVGCIVWLPSREDGSKSIKCIRELCCPSKDLDEDGYDHPVVVLKVSQNDSGDTVCSIVLVTSKERNDTRFEQIKISQEKPTRRLLHDNDIATELYLEKGEMRKQSYVVLEHIFQVSASQLRSCSFDRDSCPYDTRCRSQSYTLLMERLHLEPEDWVLTTSLQRGIARPRDTPGRRRRSEGNRNGFVTRYPEENSLPHNNTFPRTPGEYHQHPVGRDSHNNKNSGYRSSVQGGHVPPPEDNGGDGIFSLKGFIGLLTVASLALWNFRRK